MSDAFRDAILAAGMTPPDVIEPGRFHRFPGHDKGRANRAGWCKLFPDGMGGAYGDFSTGLDETWQAKRSRPLSLVEQEGQREEWRRAREQAEAEREQSQAEAATEAATLWQDAPPSLAMHPYLVAKGIRPHGARLKGAELLIPMRDGTGAIRNIQRIPPEGSPKKFFPGAAVTGNYLALGKPTDSICIVEGFATGASVFEATGRAVAVAFNTCNLEPVARYLRGKYPHLTLILCADDDYRTEGNPGIRYATQAAQAVGGVVAVPEFGPVRPDGATDFNDLHQLHGTEAVERAIAGAKPPEVSTRLLVETEPPGGDSWPLPEPLIAEGEAAPYPVEALPDGIREAVQEVTAFVQCPPALAGCSALSALSLAGQGLADVERAEGLSGPISLYTLAIAESGERKTSCDKQFLDGIREWEAAKEEATRSEMARARADFNAWEEEVAGIGASIRQLAKSGEDLSEERARLNAAQARQPRPYRVPKLIRADVTPEALTWGLAMGWPSGGVMTSEAGTVFGGHGMGRDSVMRNLSLYNALWDGGTHRVERRGSECYTLSGVRLTMGLAAQPETVRQFLEATKGLARGNGFAARFLIADPGTTQGTRLFKPPSGRVALRRFKDRLLQLLALMPNPNEVGALELPILKLESDAFEVWRRFHDDVEAELRPGGELAEVRDVASKAADNVARLAALFHLYRHGPTGTIEADSIGQAGRIVGWHLFQARSFLGDVSAPPEMSHARRLDAWLVDWCRIKGGTTVSRRDVQNRGPVRKGAHLDAALAILVEAGRARVEQAGRATRIAVNPALVEAP